VTRKYVGAVEITGKTEPVVSDLADDMVTNFDMETEELTQVLALRGPGFVDAVEADVTLIRRPSINVTGWWWRFKADPYLDIKLIANGIAGRPGYEVHVLPFTRGIADLWEHAMLSDLMREHNRWLARLSGYDLGKLGLNESICSRIETVEQARHLGPVVMKTVIGLFKAAYNLTPEAKIRESVRVQNRGKRKRST
jgi:hypothetical protein